MRKVYYINTQEAGQRFWDAQWTQASLEDAIKYCEIDYLRPIFLDYFPSRGPILEGGCGLGQYVVYYQSLGYEIYGLDWLSEPLRRVKQHRPPTNVLTGDVLRLPFKSKSLKAYYSGGVVEHFEGGPSLALREAHRVLDDDGLLLITVPYLNAKRRLEDFLHLLVKRQSLKAGKNVDGIEVLYKLQGATQEGQAFLNGYHFHEYMFTRREFSRFLEEAGFRVLRAHGICVQWGLMEFQWIRAFYRRIRGDRSTLEGSSNDGKGQPNPQEPRAHLPAGLRRLLKDLLVSEHSGRLMTRPILWLLRTLVGHLVLFVCQKAS